MLSEKMRDALDEQLNWELYSAYLYVSMAAYFDSVNLPGFANWMRVQAQEELMHAYKFYNYVNGRGSRVILRPIEGPPTEWDSPVAVFEAACEHEQKVTGRINDLVNLAASENDHATNIFLQWFVTEQVEEEATANGVVQKLKLIGDAKGALYMLDREMGQRVFTPPVSTGDDGVAR